MNFLKEAGKSFGGKKDESKPATSGGAKTDEQVYGDKAMAFMSKKAGIDPKTSVLVNDGARLAHKKFFGSKSESKVEPKVETVAVTKESA